MVLTFGGTDRLTTLPKRAMCFVEIILILLGSKKELFESVPKASIVSRQVGKKKVVVGGNAMEGRWGAS